MCRKAIDAAYHAAVGPRNNPGAEQNIAQLLVRWRHNGWPAIHIRHDATSVYRPGQEGNHFKQEVAPRPGETILAKQTNSAFIGTGLEQHLRERAPGAAFGSRWSLDQQFGRSHGPHGRKSGI